MLLGCSDNNESNNIVVGEIVGQWKLIYVHERSWDSYISDTSAKNIVYNFKSNGTLVVISEQPAPHKEGQHNYSFAEETIIIGGESFESFVVKIGDEKWLYSSSEEQMSISQLDNEGGTLTFVRK